MFVRSAGMYAVVDVYFPLFRQENILFRKA